MSRYKYLLISRDIFLWIIPSGSWNGSQCRKKPSSSSPRSYTTSGLAARPREECPQRRSRTRPMLPVSQCELWNHCDVTTPTDPWTIVAAIATAISAAVVAWQAVETRRSVRQARKSAEQAVISARAAQDAVAISQEILRDSQIARIDAGMPRVIVRTKNLGVAGVLEETARGDEKIPTGDSFVLPRDANRRLFFTRKIEILNEGPGTVTLTMHQPLTLPASERSITVRTLAPLESIEGIYTVGRSIQDWIDIAETRETGHPGPEHAFTITHTGPRDAEAVEYITVVTGGTVLQRVPDAPATWRVEQPANVNSIVTPATRTYWQSKTNNQLFSTN